MPARLRSWTESFSHFQSDDGDEKTFSPSLSGEKSVFPIRPATTEQREKIKFVVKMMMIGVLRNNRNSSSRISNRSGRIQLSSTLIKRSSCSKRVKEKENRATRKANRSSSSAKSE